MATHTSVDSFVAAMQRYQANSIVNSKLLVRRAAASGVDVLRPAVISATGGDGRLSGTKTRTAKGVRDAARINAAYDEARKARVQPTAIVKLRGGGGPLALIENAHHSKHPGIRRHAILPIGLQRAFRQKGALVDRRRRRQLFNENQSGAFAGLTPLRTPFGPRYAVYDHPGVAPGRMPDPWSKNKRRAQLAAAQIIRGRWARMILDRGAL